MIHTGIQKILFFTLKHNTNIIFTMKNGYIYKLCIKDGSMDECYIGSTVNPKERKRAHKNSCDNENYYKYNYRVYKFIRENGGFENWDLHILEKIKFDERIELLKCERKWVEKIKPELNNAVPSRTTLEYRKENREEINRKKREQSKVYRENNKDKVAQGKKVYYTKNKTKIFDRQRDYYAIKNKCPICKKEMRRDSLYPHLKNIHKTKASELNKKKVGTKKKKEI